MDIASELQRRRSALPQLEARRAELAAELEQISTAIAALGGTATVSAVPSKGARRGRPPKAAGAAAGGSRRRPKNDAALPDALAKVLAGKTMSVSDAADAVVKAGYKSNSAHFRTMVNIALLNKKRFKRVERGQYTAA